MSLVDIDAYQCRSTTPEVVLIATIMHGPDSAAEWAVTDDGHESPSSPTFAAGGTRHAKEEEGGRSDGGTRVFQDLYDDAVSRMKRRQQREIDRELQEASEMEQKNKGTLSKASLAAAKISASTSCAGCHCGGAGCTPQPRGRLP